MKKIENYKELFWALLFIILFIPITNSFFVNLNKLVQYYISNDKYQKLLSELSVDNNNLKSKIRYYKTTQGLKELIKDRLEKVDNGEILIKYSDEN